VARFGRNLCEVVVSCCISPPFGGLSTTRGEITYVLLTRAPLYWGRSPFSHDLHVLGAPLTFVLSQDQTLQLDPSASDEAKSSLPCCSLSPLIAGFFTDVRGFPPRFLAG
jgi:hypothetical protein